MCLRPEIARVANQCDAVGAMNRTATRGAPSRE
jgi:hypothetical protein